MPRRLDCFDGSLPHEVTLNGVLAIDRDELWAVGERGTLAHRRVTGWETYETGLVEGLHDVWGTNDDLWVVGGRCVPSAPECAPAVILRVRQGVVEHLASPLPQQLLAVHGRGPDDVWLVGNLYPTSAVLHWNGSVLEPRTVPLDPTQEIVGVVAIGTDEALLVGGGCIYRARGATITTILYPPGRPEDCGAPLEPTAAERRAPHHYHAMPSAQGALVLGSGPIDGGVVATWIEGTSITHRGCPGIGLSHPVGAFVRRDGTLLAGLDSGEVIHLDRERCLSTSMMPMTPYAMAGTDAPWWVGTRGRVLRGPAE